MALLAACADTGADGKAVSTASGSGADYLTAVTSGPVATADVVAASTWASAVKQAGTLRIGGTRTSLVFSQEDPRHQEGHRLRRRPVPGPGPLRPGR